MCISPVKVYIKHKKKRKYFFIKGLREKKWEKGLNHLSVPIINGITYTVPCACRRQENHLPKKTGPRSTECGAGGTEPQSGAVE